MRLVHLLNMLSSLNKDIIIISSSSSRSSSSIIIRPLCQDIMA